MTSDRGWWGLCAGLALGAWLGACAVRSPQTSSPPNVGGLDHRDDRKAQIQTLDDKVSHAMGQIGADVPTDTDVTEAMVAHQTPAFPAASVASTCPSAPPTGGTCDDVCTLADSICEDARKICDLADQLSGDDWAAQRCESGRLSCERASARCCGCT